MNIIKQLLYDKSKWGKITTEAKLKEAQSFAVKDEQGNFISPGDILTDFRGDKAKFKYISRGASPGKSAKVVVQVLG